MKHETGQPTQLTLDDHWLFDHHVEEVLRTFCAAAHPREIDPDPSDEPFPFASCRPSGP